MLTAGVPVPGRPAARARPAAALPVPPGNQGAGAWPRSRRAPGPGPRAAAWSGLAGFPAGRPAGCPQQSAADRIQPAVRGRRRYSRGCSRLPPGDWEHDWFSCSVSRSVLAGSDPDRAGYLRDDVQRGRAPGAACPDLQAAGITRMPDLDVVVLAEEKPDRGVPAE